MKASCCLFLALHYPWREIWFAWVRLQQEQHYHRSVCSVQYFHVSKQWHSCQRWGWILTRALMLMRATAHGYCENIVTVCPGSRIIIWPHTHTHTHKSKSLRANPVPSADGQLPLPPLTSNQAVWCRLTTTQSTATF